MLVLFLVSFKFNDFRGWMLDTSFDSFNQQAIGNRVETCLIIWQCTFSLTSPALTGTAFRRLST